VNENFGVALVLALEFFARADVDDDDMLRANLFEAEAVQLLFQSWRERFVKVVPASTKKSPPVVVESVRVEDQKKEESTLSLELVH